MKKVNLIGILIAYSICSFAQEQLAPSDYRPFALNGKVWETQVGIIMENMYGYRIEGDTVIGGECWMKVFSYLFPDLKGSYFLAVREVGHKVYAIAKGSNRPRLLYDFGLKEGDMVRCGIEGNTFGCLLDRNEEPDSMLGFPYLTYLKVERIDTVEARGLRHCRYILTMLDQFYEPMMMVEKIVWVEGVGSGAGPFSPWMPLPPQDTFLLRCDINKACFFGFEDFYKAEATDAVSNIQPQHKKMLNTYDLSGRRLAAPPKKGVFIMDGKKVGAE